MAVDDVHSLSLQGTYCGVPVAIGMAYKQIGDDPVGVNAGRQLIDKWFNTAAVDGGPWRQIRGFLTDALNWECAIDTFGDGVITVFLTDANGTNANASYPSPCCAQINIPASNPVETSREGRFFLPGVAIEDGLDFTFRQLFHNALRTFATNLVEIDDLGGGQGPRYHLMPHAEYLGLAGDPADVFAFTPYHDCFIKVLGSRRSDACTAFVATGGAGFAPIVVVPEPP